MNRLEMRIGTFNPEGLWRDPHTATLPTLNLPKSNQEIERLDELLFPWRGEAAAFLTRYKMDSSHLDYLKRLKPAVAYSYIQHDATIRLDDHDFYRLVGENLYPTSHRTYTFRPYAITRPFVDLVRLHGVDWSFPPLSAVEMVNSKTFSTEASELVEDQSFGTVVRSIQELTRFLRASEQSALLVKDPFGVSGAGQILIRDRSTAHRLVQHLEDQISLGQRIELIVEPYTPFQKEFGCYYLIERDGAISLQGLRMTHNRGFSYAGSGSVDPVLLPLLEERGYHDLLIRYCSVMWKKGYWGPVCFDSGLTNAGVLRSVIEINARMSMGMIAHDLCMYLAQFEVIAELHRVSLVVEEGFTYQTLQRHLTNAGLLWRPGMESGVIPLTSGSLCDTQAGGKRRRLPWFVASVGLHLRECQAACKRLEAMSTSGAVKVLFT